MSWPTLSDALLPGKASKYKGVGTDIDPTALQGGGWQADADEAHFYAECSGKGICDRGFGVCKCFDGYEGGACQRTKCPNDCSGHGICTKVADLASGGFFRFSDSVNRINTYEGVTRPFTYNLWDGEKNTKCVCDAGYTGSDCSMRSCPRGDDPLTVASPLCGNEACTAEVQGFTINGADSNDKKTYRIKFYDYEGVTYYTNAFTILTKIGTAGEVAAARLDSNEVAIKSALESLPLGVTGNVTVGCSWDNTGIDNVRCTVEFTTPTGDGLSGNVPEFVVEAITGAPPVAQPSQPVHVFSIAAPVNTNVVTIDLYPNDMNGFRLAEFSTAASVTVAGTDIITAVSEALQDRSKGVPAFVYKHGISGATIAYSAPYLTIVMPSKQFGANKIKLTVAGTSYRSDVDTKDGNKEASLCSNRGLCDYSAGLCNCFPGYIGKSCEKQSALAM